MKHSSDEKEEKHSTRMIAKQRRSLTSPAGKREKHKEGIGRGEEEGPTKGRKGRKEERSNTKQHSPCKNQRVRNTLGSLSTCGFHSLLDV